MMYSPWWPLLVIWTSLKTKLFAAGCLTTSRFHRCYNRARRVCRILMRKPILPTAISSLMRWHCSHTQQITCGQHLLGLTLHNCVNSCYFSCNTVHCLSVTIRISPHSLKTKRWFSHYQYIATFAQTWNNKFLIWSFVLEICSPRWSFLAIWTSLKTKLSTAGCLTTSTFNLYYNRAQQVCKSNGTNAVQ